ncbi:TRAP transporter substrate-binding protein [Chloroflexota bacterium]
MRKIGFLLIASLIVSLVIVGCTQPASTPTTPAQQPAPSSGQTDVIELKLAHSVPPVTASHKDIIVPWTKIIEERTAAIGKPVKIKIFPGGALAKIPEQYDIIPKGITDIGMWTPHILIGKFPLNDVTQLPFLYPSATVAAQVFKELLDTQPAFKEEYAETKVLYFCPTPPSTLIGSKTRHIKTLDDFKGMKMVANAKMEADAIKTLGAVPVVLPITGTYVALERGTADSVAKNWDGFFAFKFYEVSKYRTIIPKGINVSPLLISMNWDSWNKLPPEVQEVFEEVNKTYSKTSGEVFDATTTKCHGIISEYDKKANNPAYHTVSDADFESWIEAVTPMYEKWISDTEAKGKPAKAIFDTALELVEKYSKQ